MSRLITAICVVALAGSTALFAQQAAPPTWEQTIFTTWKNLHDKILVMAKDTVYPDAKLGSKPHPDSRSILEEFRHDFLSENDVDDAKHTDLQQKLAEKPGRA